VRASDYASIVPKILVIPLRNRAGGYPTLRRWSHNFFSARKAAAALKHAREREREREKQIEPLLLLLISDFTRARVSLIRFGPELLRVHFSPSSRDGTEPGGSLINVHKVHNTRNPISPLTGVTWASRRKLNRTRVIWIRTRRGDIHADSPFAGLP